MICKFAFRPNISIVWSVRGLLFGRLTGSESTVTLLVSDAKNVPQIGAGKVRSFLCLFRSFTLLATFPDEYRALLAEYCHVALRISNCRNRIKLFGKDS